MIANKHKLDKFYQKLILRENISYKKALRIYEGLYKEAITLKAITAKNILDGLEIDLKIARILNRLT